MIRLSLFLILTVLLSNFSIASHVAGGSIKYTYIGKGVVPGTHKYKVTLGVYRDCNGIRYSTSTEKITAVCMPGKTPVIVQTAQKVNYIPKLGQRPANMGAKDVSAICRNKSSRCNGTGNPGGYEVSYYETIFDLPACDYWEIYMSPSQCCRNGTTNSTGSYFAPVTRLFSKQFPVNSSPIFSDAGSPFPIVCAGQDVDYNIGAYDSDGDSLRYFLDAGIDRINSPGAYTYVSYSGGFSATSPIPGIKLDSITGQINFKTTRSGRYLVAFWVVEFEPCTGKEIGRTHRELQFDVRACSNSTPRDLTGVSVLSTGGRLVGKNKIEVCRGEKVSWQDTIYDSDVTDTLYFTSNVKEVLPGAKMIVTSLARNRAVVKFEWVANISKNNKKTFFLKYDDNRCDFPAIGYTAFQIDVKNGTFAGEDQVVCVGDTAILNASGGNLYTWKTLSGSPIVPGVNWFSDTTVFDTGRVVKFIPNKSPTILEVKSNPGIGCFSGSSCNRIDTIIIKIADSFKVNTIPDLALCNPASGQLNVYPTNNKLNYSYSWDSSTVLSNYQIKNPVFSNLKADAQFKVTVTSDSGCTRMANINLKVTEPFPSNMKAMVSDTLVCLSKQVKLWVSNGSVDYGSCAPNTYKCQGDFKDFTLGSGTDTNLTRSIGMPVTYASYSYSQKSQYLYKASDLRAMGMEAGPIKSIAWELKTLFNNSAAPFNKFTIKIGCSGLSDLQSTGFENISTTVFSPKGVVPKIGWNVHNFDQEYDWDGTSNLIIEVCWENSTIANGHHTQTFDKTTYKASSSYFQTNTFTPVACSNNSLSPGFPLTFLPRTRFNSCSGIRNSRFNYSWMPTSNGGFIGATNKDSATANANIATAKKYFVYISDSATGLCKDTLSVNVNVLSAYDVLPNHNPVQCLTGGFVQLKSNTPWNIIKPGGRWSGVGVINDTLGIWDPIKSGLGKHWVKYSVTGNACAAVDSAQIEVVGKPNASLLAPDSLCGIYGGGTIPDTLRHRLIPLIPGGWFSGLGVDSTKNKNGRTVYYVNGRVFKPTTNHPDTAYIKHKLFAGCFVDTVIRVPVFAPWDNSFLGVKYHGVPYPTVAFCANNPTFDTLAVKGPNPVWEYLDNPNAIVDRNMGVLDVSMASFGRDTIGRIKVGNYGFCGTDTTILVSFVKPPEIEVLSLIYCDSYVNDPKNFAKIDTAFIRIPKGPILAGSNGKKKLNPNGFDPATEVKVSYANIREAGWPQAIDQVTNQFEHNYWDGKPWMALPNVARYRVGTVPKGKNQLIYNFGYRYRGSGHPSYACYSRDTGFVEVTDTLEITLKDTHRICGSSSVMLDAGNYYTAKYLWSNGKTTRTIQAQNSGTYFVSVTSSYCSNAKSTLVIDGCVGIEENMESGVSIKLFPNPASTVISMKVSGAKSEITELRILNLQGAEVSKSIFNTPEMSNSLEIDLSNLSGGTYLFEVRNGESKSTYRVVVE